MKNTWNSACTYNHQTNYTYIVRVPETMVIITKKVEYKFFNIKLKSCTMTKLDTHNQINKARLLKNEQTKFVPAVYQEQ